MSLRRVAASCLLIFVLVALASVEARAQALVSARILSSEGPVEIERRAEGQPTLTKIVHRVNDELLAGDLIKTLKGGRLVVGLSDGSQAIIGEKTTVEITDLSQTPRTIFNVLRGKTRIKIEKMGGRPNPYRVNTPTAVIAVRGTLFDVFVKEAETQVFVHEGEVAVSSTQTPERPVILSPGFRTRVQQTQPPDAPTHFQPGLNNDTFKPRPPGANDNGRGRGPNGERGANNPPQGPPGNDSGRDNRPPDRPGPGDQRGEGKKPEELLPDKN
jgi:hypothetical protein